MDRVIDGQAGAHRHDDDRVLVDLNAEEETNPRYHEQDEQRGQHADQRHLEVSKKDQDR